MTSLEGNGGSYAFRLLQLERDMDRLEQWRSNEVDPQRATHAQQMIQMNDSVRQMSADVRGLRRTLMTFAVSIATSSVIFGLSILAATGKI